MLAKKYRFVVSFASTPFPFTLATAVFDEQSRPVDGAFTHVAYEIGTARNARMAFTLGTAAAATLDGVYVQAVAGGPPVAAGAAPGGDANSSSLADGGGSGDGFGALAAAGGAGVFAVAAQPRTGEQGVGVVVIVSTFDAARATGSDRQFAFYCTRLLSTCVSVFGNGPAAFRPFRAVDVGSSFPTAPPTAFVASPRPSHPTTLPSASPTAGPTAPPTTSAQPLPYPTTAPTARPSASAGPTPVPTARPAAAPSAQPSPAPTLSLPPTPAPTPLPTLVPTAEHQAGVAVVPHGPRLAVAEGGGNATFTVVLLWEPLDTVVVTPFSADKRLVFHPAAAVFTYKDWSVPVEVAVTASVDHVDQGGAPQAAAVDFHVASRDSAAACARNKLRARCGQAAPYNRFAAVNGVPGFALPVWVTNADKSEVIIKTPRVVFVFGAHSDQNTSAVLTATISNFGDPLQCATYQIALSTIPSAPVEFIPAGFSNYTTVSPFPIVIEPTQWREPVTVTVCAGAASFVRPVCPGASQTHCPDAGLYDRNETFRHYLVTRDPLYQAVGGLFTSVITPTERVGLGFMKLVVQVVYDRDPPPSLTGVRFTNLLNAVRLARVARVAGVMPGLLCWGSGV